MCFKMPGVSFQTVVNEKLEAYDDVGATSTYLDYVVIGR